MGSGEAAAYWVVRTGLAVAGLLVIFATVVCHFLSPGLYYDHLPKPPAIRDQLPSIALEVALGALLLLPHRLTMRPLLFWLRLAVSAAVGLIFVWAAVEGIVAGLRGGRDPAIYAVAIGGIIAGISLPGCLWWSARRTTRCNGLAMRPSGVDNPVAASH